MKWRVPALLVLTLVLAAACQPLSTPTPAGPQPLVLKWPAPNEAVDADPLLQWESFPGATHYQVTLLNSGAEAILEQDTTHPLLRVSPPLPKGARYDWNVQAQDANHAILAELTSQFSVKEDLILVWPPDREPVDASPILQWQAFAGAVEYRLQIAQDQADPPRVAVDQTVADHQYAVTPALQPGNYRWTVQALDTSQVVLAELESRFSVKYPLALLEPADGAEVGTAPLFRWVPFDGAAQYRVLVVAADAYPPAVVLDALSRSTQWVVNPPLNPETDYSLTIQALDRAQRVLAESNTTFRVFAVLPFFDCGSVQLLPAAECQALVALYQATGGASWADNANWLSTNSPCEWSGVSCTDGHVTELYLSYRALTGSLPAALADLTALRVLDLHNNQLAGPIPPELAHLEHLSSLDLSRNQLSGSLPPELAQLSALELMLLNHNQLSGELPAAWGAFQSLRHLDLTHNAFTGTLPAEWGQLQSLESLRLGYNQLEGTIPAAIGELGLLTELDVQYNALSGAVPAPLLALPYRALWGNQLDGTLRCEGAPPMPIEVQGIRFICVSSLAASVWPEVLPAIPSNESAPFWEARPEHLRFTLAGAPGAGDHVPLGASLSNQAQVLAVPAEALLDLDRMIRLEFGDLLDLLAQRPATVEGELPLLPLNNAGQLLHARLHYVDFENGSGVCFLTQFTMGPSAVNNQELFYTFQGMTADRSYFVAAFFPVAHANLPATGQLSDEAFANLMADYPAYLADTIALLEAQAPETFTPDLAQIDRLIESLVVHGD